MKPSQRLHGYVNHRKQGPIRTQQIFKSVSRCSFQDVCHTLDPYSEMPSGGVDNTGVTQTFPWGFTFSDYTSSFLEILCGPFSIFILSYFIVALSLL